MRPSPPMECLPKQTRHTLQVHPLKAVPSGLYADFVALWLLIHESRFGASDALPSDCPLERWRDAGREAGAKARDRLGVGVEAALKELGSGFIEHPANGALRDAIERGTLTSQALYEELLRLVYRLIFLFTTEDRGHLHDPNAGDAAKALYADGYSVARLRNHAARRVARDANHDLYEGLKIVFRSLWRGEKERVPCKFLPFNAHIE
jgi:hypothetical protein